MGKEKEKKEEVKEEVKDYSIEEQDQKRLKGISKFIYVIAKILKVFAIIGIAGIAILMILIPVATSSIKSDKDDYGQYIKLFDHNFYYERSEEKVEFFEKDKEDDKIVIKAKSEIETFNKMLDYLEKNDLTKMTIFIEVELALVVAILVIEVMLLNRVRDFFINIREKSSPFIKDNVLLLQDIGKFLIISFVITFVMGCISSLVVNSDLSIRSVSIAEILIVYVALYIFRYGVKLQNETKGKIYSEEE